MRLSFTKIIFAVALACSGAFAQELCPHFLLDKDLIVNVEGRFVNEAKSRTSMDIQWRHHPEALDTFYVSFPNAKPFRFITAGAYRYMEFENPKVKRQLGLHHLRETIGNTPLRLDDLELLAIARSRGAKIAEDYSSELMNGIQMAIRDLYREAQSLLPELDFYLGEEAACAVINPRNSVLPLIRPSVLKRRDIDDLVIYDKRHHLLLERYLEQNMLLDISAFPMPEFKDPAEAYSYLWPFVRDRRFDVRAVPGQKKSGSAIEPLWLKAS